jgi:septal ring factor EnvC (AmiA/AmiB activator)
MNEEETNNTSWLDGQTMTIPIEEFIKLRIEMARLEKKNDDLYSRIWSTESRLEETQKNLDDAKAQIAELLGIKELEKVKEEQDA